MWYQWTCQSNLLSSATGQRPEHWEHTHNASHATAAPVLCLELFHLCTSPSSASLFASLRAFSLFLLRCCSEFWPLSPSASLGAQVAHTGLTSLLQRPWEPELEVRVGLLYSCSSRFSLGKTRWNALRLTLTLLDSLSAVFPAEKKKKKMAGWQSGVKVFWSEEKVCNWGPWAGSLHCTSRRIIAWGYKKKRRSVFSRRGDSFQYAKLLLFHSFLSASLLISKHNWILLIDSLNAVAATGRLLCRHYWDQFQFTP